MKDDAKLPSAAIHQLCRRPGPPVAPKSRPRKAGSVMFGPTLTAAASTTAGRPSSSFDDLTKLTRSDQPSSSSMSDVARQLIRDLEQRQLQLRQRGILAVGEVFGTDGVKQ